jgi:hypothetical protein
MASFVAVVGVRRDVFAHLSLERCQQHASGTLA